MPETQFAEITARGLTAAEAAARLAREGPNTLPVKEMTIRRIVLSDDSVFDVSGEGIGLHGAITPRAPGMDTTRVRLLAVAHRRVNIVPFGIGEFPNDMEFPGIVGMQDPLRPEALAAVQRCHDAGIMVALLLIIVDEVHKYWHQRYSM